MLIVIDSKKRNYILIDSYLQTLFDINSHIPVKKIVPQLREKKKTFPTAMQKIAQQNNKILTKNVYNYPKKIRDSE